MSDETDTDEAARPAEEAPAGPLAGERLRDARRERQITVVEVAKELHLDEPKVRALEQNEFDVLGAPVFAKGYLRKYAQLVGVSVEDVLADYYSLNKASRTLPPIVGLVRRPAREISIGRWIAAIVVLIVAAAACWWFLLRPLPDTQAPAGALPQLAAPDSVSDSEPVRADPPAADEPATAIVPASLPETDVAAPAEPAVRDDVAEVVDDAPPRQSPPPAASGEVTLAITFSGDCWTEITEADGSRLFFDLGRAGRTVRLTGEAPLSLLFGNADNVSVAVGGEDYPIPESARRGQTARLSIPAR